MNKFKSGLQRISDCTDRVFIWIGVVFLIVLTVSTFVQVIGRYVFNNSPSWTDELARYSFIWANMLGMAIALKHNKHAAIDLLASKLKGTAHRAQKLVVDGFITFASILLFAEGSKMTAAIYKTGQLSAAMRIPVWIIYLSVAVGGFGLLVHCALFIYQDFAELRAKKGGIET